MKIKETIEIENGKVDETIVIEAPKSHVIQIEIHEYKLEW